MGPDKEFCQTCDGFSVLGCPFRGGSLCKPERVRMPPSADRNRDDIATIALANGYVKLADDEVVVKKQTHELATSMAAKWAAHVYQVDKEARDE